MKKGVPNGTIHGHAARRSPEYMSWQAMIQRCTNPKAPNWHKYGGRGISIDPRWRDFAAFLADMGPRPVGTTLDRRDGTAGYSKANCRWATDREQNNNRACAHPLTIDGTTMSLTEWAEAAGISDAGLLYRVRKGVTGSALLAPGRRTKAPKVDQTDMFKAAAKVRS